MSYQSGGLIEANDYNNRATAINSIWGTGAGANGYGQGSTLSTVSTSSTVTATNWASLIARLDSLGNHQTGATSGITQPTAGSVITFLSSLDTKIAASNTNKLLFNNTRGTAVPSALGNPLMSSATTWVTSAVKEFTVTFSSTDTVRYFFNAGGVLTFFLSLTSGSTTKSTDWATFLTNQVGTIALGSNYCSRSGTGGDGGFPGSGGSPTTNTNTGFHQLTTTYQTLFKIGSTSATADYGQNYITIDAKLGGSLYSTGSNIVYFRVTMTDSAADISNDNVTGTLALTAGFTPPETTYLANSWGSFSAATVTNTQS